MQWRKTLIAFLPLYIFFHQMIFSQPAFRNDIIPIDKSRFQKSLPQDSITLRWERLMNFTCSEVLNTWRKSSGAEVISGGYLDFGYLENNSKTGEFGPETKGGIRPAAQAAYSIAVALFTAAYDSVLTGVPEKEALDYTITIIKSLARDHLANRGINHAWGNQWQSTQWASKIAVSGWLLWDHLHQDDQMSIRKMIEYEANRFANIAAPAANENYQVNTHAEENGWDATGIQTACAMLPRHENRQTWIKKLYEFRLNALATSADLQNNRVVEGRKISEWITGYNIDSIGALGNHGAYPHPDYMAAPLRHTVEGALYYRLAGLEIPRANRYHYDLVYHNFCTHVWHDTSPIYKPDGNIFWPIEIEKDWRFEFITYGIIDLGAQILGSEEFTAHQGYYWEDKHTSQAMAMNLTGFIAASAYLFRWIEFQEQ